MQLLQTAGAAVVMTAASFVYYAQSREWGVITAGAGELLLQIEQLRQKLSASWIDGRVVVSTRTDVI